MAPAPSVINGDTLFAAAPIEGMLNFKGKAHGVSHGLDESGYDIRIKQRIVLHPFRRFALASSIERFTMPNNLVGIACNKSSWARKGLDAAMSTKIEPGWSGNLTLELTYKGWLPLVIPANSGILSILFLPLSDPRSYDGKYQNQEDRPVAAIHED